MGKLKTSLQKCLQSESKKRKLSNQQQQQEQNVKAPNKKSSTSKFTIVPIHNFSDGSKSLYPLKEHSKILIIGDGNFSFSKSLMEIFKANLEIWATCYDSEQDLYSKYAEAKENVEFLRSQVNCTVLFQIDVFSLAKEKRLKGQTFHRIIFNFPHVGKGIKDKMKNIMENQKLLKAYFTNSIGYLVPEGEITYGTNSVKISGDLSEYEATLSKCNNLEESNSQAEVHVTLKTGDPYDLWQVKELGKASGFRCKETFDFHFEKYPAYRHRRTIGDTIQFGEGGEDCLQEKDQIIEGKHCKTFVFCLQ